MKTFGSNAFYGFLGGAIATAVWSIITNYLRFGYVPVNPLLFGSALTGCAYAFMYAIIHWVGGFRPTLVSSIASALATVVCGALLAISVELFVGWSLLAVAALLVWACLIGSLTHVFAAKSLP